ncbi:MAG: hypothetical protein JXO72_14215 [Vicinamibacteria bacterium]|nr:hypothetical protein [Vicinamibacteria bacterium]
MKDWKDLLLGTVWEGVEDEYGPNSNAVVSAFETLSETEWFKHVGEMVSAKGEIVSVGSWQESIVPLIDEDGKIYGPNGHLLKPSNLCIEVIESERYHDLWQLAGSDAFDYCDVLSHIPDSLPAFQQDFIDEYVYEFVSFLLAEIVGSDVVGTTYFREMLSWFYAGHFPCGWVGVWPEGRMRVY